MVLKLKCVDFCLIRSSLLALVFKQSDIITNAQQSIGPEHLKSVLPQENTYLKETQNT